MIYKYDQKTDTLMLVLAKEKPDFAEQRENIITHYNKEGKPIEIEILDASKTAVNIIEAIFKGNRIQGLPSSSI